MPRRRFTREQQQAFLKAKARQAKACKRGNHTWWPDSRLETPDVKGLAPQYWPLERRYPMPRWNGETVICSACNIKGSIKKLTPTKQKKVHDMFDGFVESTVALRKTTSNA